MDNYSQVPAQLGKRSTQFSDRWSNDLTQRGFIIEDIDKVLSFRPFRLKFHQNYRRPWINYLPPALLSSGLIENSGESVPFGISCRRHIYF